MAKSLQSKLLIANITEMIVLLSINVSLNIYSFRMYKTDLNEVKMSSIKSSGAFVNMVQMKLQSQEDLTVFNYTVHSCGNNHPTIISEIHTLLQMKRTFGRDARIQHWPAARLLAHNCNIIYKRKSPVHIRNYNKYQNVKSSYSILSKYILRLYAEHF